MSRDVDAMCALLDKERDGLLRGDLSVALELKERKARLAERLEDSNHPVSQPKAQSMLAKARRNAALLSAAIEGLGAARNRIETILLGASTQTYGADGTRTEIPVLRRGLEKRA